jgi:hypothetical protein
MWKRIPISNPFNCRRTLYFLDLNVIASLLLAEGRYVSLFQNIQSGSGSNQPPPQWVPRAISRGGVRETLWTWNYLHLKSIRRDETVNVNKPSPVSPQLTARSGQSTQLVLCTHCIRTLVNLHSDVGHPCNGTPITWSLHDFILRPKEISRSFVYDYFLISANGL